MLRVQLIDASSHHLTFHESFLISDNSWQKGARGHPLIQADERRMSSIIWRGFTCHGISVFGRGVFKDKPGVTNYAGQHRDGYACGLGVATMSSDWKVYAEHGPDGQYDGRHLSRHVRGITFYGLYERGEVKDSAAVFADGTCWYNDKVCAPDDPRFLALIAQIAPVEVCPAAPAPNRHRPPLANKNRPMHRPARFAPAGARDRRGHRGASHAARPPWWL